MKLKAEEIASVIRREIETYRTSLDVSDTGTVLEVDGGLALGQIMVASRAIFSRSKSVARQQ